MARSLGEGLSICNILTPKSLASFLYEIEEGKFRHNTGYSCHLKAEETHFERNMFVKVGRHAGLWQGVK
jgi:hypothetical protein